MRKCHSGGDGVESCADLVCFMFIVDELRTMNKSFKYRKLCGCLK